MRVTTEEIAFSESARRYLDEAWPFSRRRLIIRSDEGFSREQWEGFAQLGWLGVGVGERYGGLGLGAAYLYMLMEQFGRALVVSPFVSTVVVAAAAIERFGSEELQEELLPKITEGKLIVAFANDEPTNARDPLRISALARRDGDDYVLSGRKSAVAFAHAADLMLVTARVGEGIGLFLVDPKSSGVALRTFATYDGGRASEVEFSDLRAPACRMVGQPSTAQERIEPLIDRAAAALSIDAMAGMKAVLDLTVDYAKTREQFGQKLGSFQALQHRMVDMFMTCEFARSLAQDAAAILDEPDSLPARRRVSAAKARIGRDASAVAKEGINLHGGVGLTEEYQVGHYLKRTIVLNQMFGEPAWHLARHRRLPSA